MAAACAALGVRRVLDLGCGTGHLAHGLAVEADLAAELDPSAAMFAQRPRRSPARFVSGDGAYPPFARGSFDLVTCCLVLHECGERAEALITECIAVAPRALVLEWRMPERHLDYALTFWVHGIERLVGRGHYRSFLRFMLLGGLHGLARRCGARVTRETALGCNSLVLALLEQ